MEEASPTAIDGGSGADDVEIDSDIPYPPSFSYPPGVQPGTSELDIYGDPTGGGVYVKVSSGLLQLSTAGPQVPVAFTTLQVFGTSPTGSAPITNTMITDGSLLNVTLVGGSGADVTNKMSAMISSSTGTSELIGGNDATNDLTAAGGMSTLIGRSGVNCFTLEGPGDYTVDGVSGATDALVVYGDIGVSGSETLMDDTVDLNQVGTTVYVNGYTEPQAGLFLYKLPIIATATNISSVSLTGGSGDDYLDASGMSMGVTLDGGTGTDTLIGGAGNDTLNYENASDSYNGGGGTDNVLLFNDPTTNGVPNAVTLYSAEIVDTTTGARYPLPQLTNINYFETTSPSAPVSIGDNIFPLRDWTTTLQASDSDPGGSYSCCNGNVSDTGYLTGTDTPPSSPPETLSEAVTSIASGLYYDPSRRER